MDGGVPLVATVYVPGYTGCAAVHFFGSTIRFGRAHNQLFELMDDPSSPIREASGTAEELGRKAARWVRDLRLS